MHKSSKTFQFIFFLCLVVFSSFKIALPMEKTSIIVSDPPLDDKYMTKYNITQGFCCENRNWENDCRIHNGIDIYVPSGEPVYGIANGTVVFNNNTWEKNVYMNSFLIVEHDGNTNGEKFYIYYGHVSCNKEIKEVAAGKPIGTIKHDESGECEDHLHLSFGFGKDWDHFGWGYNCSCEDVETEGYVNPLKYLTFKGESRPGKMISCEPESIPTPPSPIPIRPRNMKFDVKTKFMEKELTAAAKAGFISYIHQSSWAKIVEFGEDNSLWLKNYKRSSKGDRIFIELDLEIRSPAMISEGYLIKRKSLNFEFDESQVKKLYSFRDPQVYEAIKKQLAGQNIPITSESILQEMGFIFKQGYRKDPSPCEALEGLIVGAYLMKALEEQFTTY
ncbi:MAG TPA: M23 family metallopeptidase [Candidatus Deferrimicrobium sp.]|nr:M23 family metallopeptidase [Candidatus Deferrimicrobium sp.]